MFMTEEWKMKISETYLRSMITKQLRLLSKCWKIFSFNLIITKWSNTPKQFVGKS